MMKSKPDLTLGYSRRKGDHVIRAYSEVLPNGIDVMYPTSVGNTKKSINYLFKDLSAQIKGSFTESYIRRKFNDVDISHLKNFLEGENFHSSGCNIFELIDKVKNSFTKSYITIQIDSSLQLLPWEIIPHPNGNSLLGDFCIFNYQIDDLYPKIKKSFHENPIRVRVSQDTSLIGSAQEKIDLQSIKEFNCEFLPPIVSSSEKEEFFDFFCDKKYNVVHFGCHCSYFKSGGIFSITTDRSINIDLHDFRKNKKKWPSGAFYFLNTCNSAPNIDNIDNSISSYVLKQLDPGAAIATTFKIKDQDAVNFSKEFYQASLMTDSLGKPVSIAAAMMYARKAMKNEGSIAGYLYRVIGNPDFRMVGRIVGDK